MTVTIDVHEANTHLSRILERVAAGERIVISRAEIGRTFVLDATS